MQFMTGHINYGGRVTDDNDRVLLISILSKCYGQHILKPGLIHEVQAAKGKRLAAKKKIVAPMPEFTFFGSEAYRIPKENMGLEDVHSYIDSLPQVDVPEIFGMHKNADIAY